MKLGASLLGALAAAAIALSCGGEPAPGEGGHGGMPRSSTSQGHAGGAGGHGTITVGGSGGSSTSSSSGSPVQGARLVIPAAIDLPYTVAGQGGSKVTVEIANDGDAPFGALTWSISGAPSITLDSAPPSLAAGAKGKLMLSYAGAPAEAITSATLTVQTAEGNATLPVFAVTGDPGLGAASWEEVLGPGGAVFGAGATVDMPAAPFPASGAGFTDASVRVFLPEGYRDRGAQDVVIHFHGWSTTLDKTLADHQYQEHVYSSGANAVLVVPQGPVNAPSGDFGKLLAPGGIARLVDEVLVMLYREGKIAAPTLGTLALTSHSGGYRAVATNLDAAAQAPAPALVDLFDSLYGFESTFEAFALGGGRLRSNYTQGGGTLASNQAVAASLKQQGLSLTTEGTVAAMKAAGPLIDFTAASHDGSTRVEGAYGERLRWAMPRARRGPRIELRAAFAQGNVATVRWMSPPDDDLQGFVVERSEDGVTWSVAKQVGPTEEEATFPLPKGARVRVRAEVTGLDPKEVIPSDTYRVDPDPAVLVVDGFDRVLDGSFGGLHHDFAALVGEAAGPVLTLSHRAVVEEGFDLSTWPTVIWLLGDESSGDLAFSSAEQQLVRAYLDGGGHLIASGSEIAWSLAQITGGPAFLDDAFGAKYLADSSGSHTIAGTGALAAVPSTGFAAAGAPYACPYPDVLSAAPGGEVILLYGNGKVAATGVPGRGALVGFPLELVTSSTARAALVQALVSFVNG